jgi:hypothetical protein
LYVKTIEPQSEDPSLSLALGIKIVNLKLLFLRDRVESRMGIEQICNKGQI